MTDFSIKAGDTAPALTVALKDGTNPLNLTAATVRFRMRPKTGGALTVDQPAAIVGNPLDGIVKYQWQTGDTAAPGLYEVEWPVTFGNGEKQTFPADGYMEVEVEAALTAVVEALPAMPSQCWPVDIGCCSDFDNYSTSVQDRAKALATQTLRALTGYRVGGCAVTVTPLKADTCYVHSPVINAQGAWVNNGVYGCCAAKADELALPGPIGRVDSVKIDGVTLAAANYKVVDAVTLLRTDADWPADKETIEVTYLRGIPVDGLGSYAAGILACEYAKACSGGKCRLPAGVTEISRQGISMTIPSGAFPDGKTGIREVDAYIMRWNPNGLKAPSTVWTPDQPKVRTTTWQA